MKTYLFTVSLVCLALLVGCKGRGGDAPKTETPATEKTELATEGQEVQTPEEQEGEAITEDVAQNVLKLVDRKFLRDAITEEELSEAMNTPRTFDEYTSPLHIDITHSYDGCYDIAYIECYPRDDKSYYALVYTEAGVDGAVLQDINTFIYKDGILVEEDNPFQIPTFEEFFGSVDVPADLQADLKRLKIEMKGQKDFRGLDMRRSSEDKNVLQFRPSYIFSDALWELAKPVEYKFNGQTFVKL